MSAARTLTILSLCILPLAAVSSAAPGLFVAPQSQPKTHLFDKSPIPLPANIYCKLNGMEVTRAEYGDWLQKFHGDVFIQEYVLARLVREAAKQYNVSVPRSELEQFVNRVIEEKIMKGYRGRKELFIERELANYGKSMEDYKAQIVWDEETELLIQKILKAKRLTTDADVQAEFKRLYGSSGRELYLRAILIEPDTPSLTSHRSQEEIAQMMNKGVEIAQKKAAAIVKKLMSGNTDFKTEALSYSDDYVSRVKNGDIGLYTSSPPMFGPEFDAIIQKTPVGKLVGPIRIQAGFIIAEITKEVPHDIAKERDAIRKELVDRDATENEVVEYKGMLLYESTLVR